MDASMGLSPTQIDIDPFSEETLRDFGSFDKVALEAASVIFLPRYDLWALARHDLVKSTFADWRRFSSANGTGLTHIGKSENWRRPSLILENDPPNHARYRKILAKVLTGETLREIRDRFTPVADNLAREAVSRGSFDAVQEFAEMFPLAVVPAMLGLPEEASQVMLVYSDLNFNSMGPENAVLRQSRERAEPLTERVMQLCRRENLERGGLGDRIYELCEQEEIPAEDAAILVRTFFSASMDTTINGIAFAIEALANRPDQWAMLHADPSLAIAAFEEGLRWRSPSPYIGRTTNCDVEIEGVIIPADSKVLMLVAAANRDPRRFDRPDDYDFARDDGGHVAFGVGIHACIGQMVARLEAELALGALAREAATIISDGEPKLLVNNWLRGFTALPVKVEAA